MPNIGDIETKGGRKHIWLACRNCGREKWVRLKKGEPEATRCVKCARAAQCGDNHPRWKGGHQESNGYILIKLQTTDFFYPMVNNTGYVGEHRLIMAQHLGRNLQPWEIIHHKNGVRSDNRLRNLELTIRSTHSTDHTRGYRDGYRQGYQDGQSEAIRELKQQIKLLQWEIKQFKERVDS